MGVLLARGIGARQDFARAFGWFSLAAAGGDADAARKRDEVAARLGAAELAAARAAVEQWRPRPADPVANGVPAPGRTAAAERTANNKS
jgi:localization factor PodJL